MSAPDRSPWILRAPAARQAAGSMHHAPPLPGGREAPSSTAAATAPPLISLFCFPPAGSGACVFHGWEQVLPAKIEVLPVELPGHNSRMKEAPLASMQGLMEDMLPALLPLMQARPFAFFGHSMGAWVAYQLAQELRRHGGPLPLKLYASANRSPLLAGPHHDVDPTVMHLLPAEAFWSAMEARYGPNPNLEHAGMRRLLLPLLQADFRLIETWRPAVAQEAAGETAPGSDACLEQLSCPVAALGATEDCRYTQQQLEAWRHSTAPSSFQQRWFKGGHSYATTDGPGRRQLLDWLAADLRQLLQVLCGGVAADGWQDAQRGHCGNEAQLPTEEQCVPAMLPSVLKRQALAPPQLVASREGFVQAAAEGAP